MKAIVCMWVGGETSLLGDRYILNRCLLVDNRWFDREKKRGPIDTPLDWLLWEQKLPPIFFKKFLLKMGRHSNKGSS